MLSHLLIKNVALIEEIEVDFEKGLNIISGETGAGKSIIIGSINFVLGERPDKDFIRSGEDMALVEALITINGDNLSVINELKDMGVELDCENNLIISRTAGRDGKTACRINGRTITVGMLKEISAFLIDVHGQHEHHSILNPNRHIDLLDRFCGERLDKNKALLAASLKRYRETVKKIEELAGDEKERAVKIDLLEFQKNEIEMAALERDEELYLAERRKILAGANKLMENASEALDSLYRSDGRSAADSIASAINNLNEISAMDSSKTQMYEMLETISLQLEEVVSELRHYSDTIENDPEQLYEVESRLDLIYNLKRKYGGSVNEILDYYEKVSEQLLFISNSEEELNKLNGEKNGLEKEIYALCAEMTEERITNALKIQSQIEAVLKDLGMPKAVFKIDVGKKEEFGNNGIDKVEFMISPNLGQDLKPLAKIASGGEMSRVMLALKVVLSSSYSIETFIFDEIDTGVSGRTAQQVAEKLALIGKTHQILCITHLPQIASMGDCHFLIEKKSDKDNTLTTVYKLDIDASIKELTRLIGGAKITDATVKAAKEMKNMAIQLKGIG